jgi:hypothetical protein
MLPSYGVRRLAGGCEEFCCLQQLEDECAAMYFNVVHGAKVRRRFTTEPIGEHCRDYVLVARVDGAGTGALEERHVLLSDIA